MRAASSGPILLLGVNLLIIGLVWVLPYACLLFETLWGSAVAGTAPSGDLLGARQLVLLARSLGLSALAAALSLFIAYPAGRTLAMGRGQRWLWIIFLAPLLIPPYVQALAWISALNFFQIRAQGIVLSSLVLALGYWPIAGFLVYAGLKGAAGHQLEAALFARSAWISRRRLELGLIRPCLLSGFVLTFILVFSDYAVPSLFRVNTYPVVVFSHFAAHHDLSAALTSCWPCLLLPVLIFGWWYQTVGSRIFATIGESSAGLSPALRPSNSFWRMASLFLPALSLAIPIVTLAAGTKGWEAFALAWKTASPQILASIGLSTFSASLLVLLALCLVTPLLLPRGRSSRIIELGIFLPAAIPGTLAGMALLFLWNRSWTEYLHGSWMILVLLNLTRFLSLIALLHWAAIRQIESTLVEAGLFSSKHRFPVLLRTIIPLLGPAIGFGWLIGFVFCLHEVTGALLVMPPGLEPLSIRIYSLYHYGAGRLVSALSLILLAIGLTVALALVGLIRLYWHAKNYRTQ